ncbi:hypothetical protein HN51_016204, partial [Arachis hypogaea]
DYSMQPPAQELMAREICIIMFGLSVIYIEGNQSTTCLQLNGVYLSVERSSLLETLFYLYANDLHFDYLSCSFKCFGRDEKQQLLLGIRLANRQPANISSSVLSSDSMHIGILAAAAHAAANNSPFTVFYNPRASPSEFVIPLAKYYKAVFLFSFSEFVRWKNSQWCNLQSITRFTAEGIGSVCGRLSIGTAEKIPESEIIGTTDARTHLLELFYTLYVPTLIQWQCCHLLLMW